ncbi:hypothetical protein KIN20_012964 [Parelaphostrongylus tenuis]|uniref:Uncharacterized protein n=1 Tax=Parelaphostrongylus tenuis TaxID=148309 RepID=A0AAD5MEV5_PARTN|nr:hypothetical protein KIN20_012964 [Parelaphostrongylus tenuis]
MGGTSRMRNDREKSVDLRTVREVGKMYEYRKKKHQFCSNFNRIHLTAGTLRD